MKENGSFFGDYALGHGGVSEVSPELRVIMSKNSESVVTLLLTSKVPDSDLRQPIGGSRPQGMDATDVGR